jgi:ATP-dependent Clp protease ATP-binding subunit ClpB
MLQKNERETKRSSVLETKTIKEQIQQLEHEAEIAEKQTDYNKVAEIRYSQLPALQKKLEENEQKSVQNEQKSVQNEQKSVQNEQKSVQNEQK